MRYHSCHAAYEQHCAYMIIHKILIYTYIYTHKWDFSPEYKRPSARIEIVCTKKKQKIEEKSCFLSFLFFSFPQIAPKRPSIAFELRRNMVISQRGNKTHIDHLRNRRLLQYLHPWKLRRTHRSKCSAKVISKPHELYILLRFIRNLEKTHKGANLRPNSCKTNRSDV